MRQNRRPSGPLRPEEKEDIMFHSLMETLEAYQKRDPAARSKLEVFLLYQGVHATLYHRLAHWLYCHFYLQRAEELYFQRWSDDQYDGKPADQGGAVQ